MYNLLVCVFYFGRNLFIALDRLLNVLLLGSCDETISERTERLRASGSKVGCVACKVMTFVFKFLKADHCDYALKYGRTLGRELWRWNK
jgi:hypothetical protein